MEQSIPPEELSLLIKYTSATQNHCAPIYRFRMSEQLEGRSAMKDLATITFVEFDNQFFGITNYHVIENLDTKNEALWIGLERAWLVNGEPIFTSTKDNIDFPFDIAIFKLPSRLFENTSKKPVMLFDFNHEEFVDRQFLAVGFTAVHAQDAMPGFVSHGLSHAFLNACSFSDRTIYLMDEVPAFDRQIGGMSGGCIYWIDGEANYKLVGIIAEGRDQRDQTVEQIHENIVVLGFPLTLQKFSEMIHA